jgi:uncharacterized protein (TIGR04141 family)
MPGLRCYRLHDVLDGEPVQDLDQYVEAADGSTTDDQQRSTFGPLKRPGFTAKLYTSVGRQLSPSWLDYLESVFGPLRLPHVRSLGATLILRLESGREFGRHFAFTFGTTGRHLLRDDAWRRAYGTRASLNLVFGPHADSARLLAVKAKRRGSRTVRTEAQSSGATNLETFGIDLLRDVLAGFTAVPFDPDTWGPRVTGTDSLAFESDRDFDELGELCLDIEAAASRDDYRRVLPWLQEVHPVSEPEEIAGLQAHVIELMRREDDEHLALAPPEIVDWERICGFSLPWDRREPGSKGRRPELRLTDLLRRYRERGLLDALDVPTLKKHRITTVDVDGHKRPQWSVWRCLVAQIEMNHTIYVLDDGGFFAVDRDFLVELDRQVDCLATDSPVLPAAKAGDTEPDYLSKFPSDDKAAVIHNRRIRPRRWTTEVEVCDILTADRQLIHVKRHLGARDLSHLFSQGSVSAQLLQDDDDFRIEAAAIAEEVSGGRWDFFLVPTIQPSTFKVVYAIVADWRSRSLSEALPLFSKVNLRSFAQQLRARYFRVGCCQVPTLDAD